MIRVNAYPYSPAGTDAERMHGLRIASSILKSCMNRGAKVWFYVEQGRNPIDYSTKCIALFTPNYLEVQLVIPWHLYECVCLRSLAKCDTDDSMVLLVLQNLPIVFHVRKGLCNISGLFQIEHLSNLLLF